MTDLSIRQISERVNEFTKYKRFPRITAMAENGEYRLVLAAVDEFGIEIENTSVQIVDARGKKKTVKSLDAVFAFAERYSIDTNRVMILGNL